MLAGARRPRLRAGQPGEQRERGGGAGRWRSAVRAPIWRRSAAQAHQQHPLGDGLSRVPWVISFSPPFSSLRMGRSSALEKEVEARWRWSPCQQEELGHCKRRSAQCPRLDSGLLAMEQLPLARGGGRWSSYLWHAVADASAVAFLNEPTANDRSRVRGAGVCVSASQQEGLIREPDA